MKLNKGEWGEPYVALKLLGDGKLYMADENGNRKPNEWLDIIELVRHETADRVVTYGRNLDSTYISISVNGIPVGKLDSLEFLGASSKLLSDIRRGRGASFEVSDDVEQFFQQAEMKKLKARSVDKSDLFLTTTDPRASITREQTGFSIKSMMGHNPTLFNTAPASAVRYRLDGATKADMEEINSLIDSRGHVAVGKRCSTILEKGITPVYVGYAITRNGEEVFKDNLDIIDPRLPKVIERILWNHFFEGDTTTDLPLVVNRIISENPCSVSRPEIKYPFMMKTFIYSAYCGLTASTPWDGEGKVNGGFITVDANGQILAHYALESKEFKDYLYKNCYLEFPSTGEGHGNYAKVYEKDGEFFYHLNFQVRYR